MPHPAASPRLLLAGCEVLGDSGDRCHLLQVSANRGDQMYVGGLGASAGGTASFVGQAPAVNDAPPQRAPYQRDQIAPRAASGAARGLYATPVGGGGGMPSVRHRRPGRWV